MDNRLSCTPVMRRELFPTEADCDGDELGHISPLRDSSPPVSPTRPHFYLEGYNPNFNKTTIADYIILENIGDMQTTVNPKNTVPDSIKTPLADKSNYADKNDLSPFYLSPVQTTLQLNVVPSPKKYKVKAGIDETLSKCPDLRRSEDSEKENLEHEFINNKFTTCENAKRKFSVMESELSPSNKHLKFDPSSKVRTVLFPHSELSVPTASFYSKSKVGFTKHLFRNDDEQTTSTRRKTSCLYLCGRKRNGQINAGVRHKIRKPKHKKITSAQLMKAALNIMDNSVLNEYLDGLEKPTDHMTENQLQVSENIGHCNDDMEKMIDLEKTAGRKRERSPSPDLNKKFFKFKRSNPATVTVDKHLKFQVNDGKLSLLANKKHAKTQKVMELNLDTTDLIVPDTENLISPDKVDDIIFNLESIDKENVTQDINVSTNQENTELVLKAYNSIAMSENAVHLHHSSTNEEHLNSNCSLQLGDEKSVLLSPTSQMCTMTSGLALNSPKKAKQNISHILNNLNNADNSLDETSHKQQDKLFPIFYGASKLPLRDSKPKANLPSKKLKPLPKNQMLLDAGQKRFGAVQCSECKFVYYMGDPGDEIMHHNYHNAENVLHFNGWKGERVVSVFMNNNRIIKVLPSDPKPWLKKVKDLLEIVNRDLGYFEMEYSLQQNQVYLYIKNKVIAGCLVAEAKMIAYRMLTDSGEVDLCSEKSYPIKCGVSRIWVSQASRKMGIATSLLSALRANFMYGNILMKEDIAFSSPTEMGKIFAAKYFGTPNFLVCA